MKEVALMGDKIAQHTRKISLQIRWLLMSPKARYAYLWQQTRNSHYKTRG